MARLIACFCAVSLLAGCASARLPAAASPPSQQAQLSSAAQPSSVDAPVDTAPEELEVVEPASAALVFSPNLPPPMFAPELSRADRQPRAFLGYDEGVAEYFSLRIDDRQYSGPRSFGISGWGGVGGSHDRYERRAVSVKTGVRYR